LNIEVVMAKVMKVRRVKAKVIITFRSTGRSNLIMATRVKAKALVTI
jgi:hypothetical protein